MSSSKYYEPNQKDEEAKTGGKGNLERKKASLRKIKVRFRNEQDVKDFIKATGIMVRHGETNKVTLPVSGHDMNKWF